MASESRASETIQEKIAQAVDHDRVERILHREQQCTLNNRSTSGVSTVQ